MDTCKVSRLIEGLYEAGWDGDRICRFILWIAKGDERFLEAPGKAGTVQ